MTSRRYYSLGATDQLDEHSLLLLGIAAAYMMRALLNTAPTTIVSADLAEYAMKSDGRFPKTT